MKIEINTETETIVVNSATAEELLEFIKLNKLEGYRVASKEDVIFPSTPYVPSVPSGTYPWSRDIITFDTGGHPSQNTFTNG